MNPYTLAADVWEGTIKIDEQVLWDGGVRGIIHRLNDVNGNLHKDQGFDAQWIESERFVRTIYYVYTPWETGKVNFEWLADNLPSDCAKRIFSDLELKKLNYPPRTYAHEYQRFVDLVTRYWDITTYTGGGFVGLLDKWPQTDYWWARYPFYLYPKESVAITWEELKRKLGILRWVPDCKLGATKLWQCSADRFKLPGCNDRCIDINVFNGTCDEFAAYIQAPEPVVTWNWAVTKALRSLNFNIPDPG